MRLPLQPAAMFGGVPVVAQGAHVAALLQQRAEARVIQSRLVGVLGLGVDAETLAALGGSIPADGQVSLDEANKTFLVNCQPRGLVEVGDQGGETADVVQLPTSAVASFLVKSKRKTSPTFFTLSPLTWNRRRQPRAMSENVTQKVPSVCLPAPRPS